MQYMVLWNLWHLYKLQYIQTDRVSINRQELNGMLPRPSNSDDVVQTYVPSTGILAVQ